MKIACVEPLGISQSDFENYKKEFESQGHTFAYYMDRKEDDENLLERMKDAEAVIISNIRLDAARLEKCPNLRYISVAFAGIDHIDQDYCKAHGITICNAADYAKHAVAELTIGLMLDVLRQITRLDKETRQGQSRNGFVGRQLIGKTVGVVGTGYIGQEVCKLLQAFGCKVIAYSRSRRKEVEAMGIEYVELDTLMQQSDIVTLHVPLTQATTHLIDQRRIAMMKPSAILVNTARGNVVDIPALAKALNENSIAGAAIDVYESEPPLPTDHALLSAPNCVCVPHIGYATHEAFDYRKEIVFGNIRDYIASQQK